MKLLLYISFLLVFSFGYSQKEDARITTIRNQLEVLASENSGFTENVKSEINVNNITLPNFLVGLSKLHNINIIVAPELNNITIANNNFNGVTVNDVLVFLCKTYNLAIDFTGNILSIKAYQEPQKETVKREINVFYDPSKDIISIDAKNDNLYEVFKAITDASGKNLMAFSGLENKSLTAFIREASFDAAMANLAQSNDLIVQKNKDNFYEFDVNPDAIATNDNGVQSRGNRNRLSRNTAFEILDLKTKLLKVNFTDTPISKVVNDIGLALDINIFSASPLEEAGSASVKADKITFDELLTKMFEANVYSNPLNNNTPTNQNTTRNQNITTNTTNKVFTFKKENDIYYFGTEEQLSVRQVELITLQYRSVELLNDPSGSLRSNNNFSNQFNRGGATNGRSNLGTNTFQNQNNSQRGNFQNQSSNINNSFNNQTTSSIESTDILEIIPEEIKQDLEFVVDVELNSIYVAGTNEKIERFKKFVTQIDKRVPVVLIEVMIIEVTKNATIEAGVTWGIGENPVETRGGIFPETDLTLGARTVNRIIGSFNDFSGFNLGKVVPDFFATIRAMETNGNLKVRSTPKLATLNGHRANFSNGETSSFAVTDRSIIGTDNPLINEIVNFIPIQAELGLNIKPSVTGDGQIILDINVIQSTFGPRLTDNGPPDLISRNFSSIIRMQDQDIAILGGLEERRINNSGSGVPFLAKIPLIKWLFSSRTRESRKSKLSVLIKPTIIY